LLQRVEIGGRGGGDDAVDHRRRTSAFGGEPACQRRGTGGEIFAEQGFELSAVLGEVVAREEGQAGEARRMAPRERLGEEGVEAALGQRRIEAVAEAAAV